MGVWIWFCSTAAPRPPRGWTVIGSTDPDQNTGRIAFNRSSAAAMSASSARSSAAS